MKAIEVSAYEYIDIKNKFSGIAFHRKTEIGGDPVFQVKPINSKYEKIINQFLNW